MNLYKLFKKHNFNVQFNLYVIGEALYPCTYFPIVIYVFNKFYLINCTYFPTVIYVFNEFYLINYKFF